jgi:6-pyruvoyltetrahydropterin/6-carboxytetrahydropterin synthase
MSFAITITREFSAAHALRLYDGTMETVHGHNWRVAVTAAAEKLDGMGVVMDFHDLERLVKEIISPWRNRNLNEVGPFATEGKLVVNPSAENVAKCVGEAVKLPAGVMLEKVEVWETGNCCAVYRVEKRSA